MAETTKIDTKKIDIKKDPVKAAIDNNPCGICRAMGLPGCKGHGGRGGGGSSSGSSSGGSETKNMDITYKSNQVASTYGQAVIAYIRELDNVRATWMQSQLSNDRTINYEAGLLSIESDRLRGNLIFRVKPNLSKNEIEISRQFLKTVKAEFEDFKNLLAEKGISTQNFTAVMKDNEVAFHIPNPKYYGEFIGHLENKNLLPVPNIKQLVKQEAANKSFNQEKNRPSPFDDILKGPKPK